MQPDELIDFGTFIKSLDAEDITPFLRNMYRQQGDFVFMYINQKYTFQHWFRKSFFFLNSIEGDEYWNYLFNRYCPNT